MPDEEYNRRYAEHCTEANDWVCGVTSAGVNVFNWRNLEENTILGPFAYCWNHFDEYTDPNATYEDLVGYSENIFNAASTLAIAKGGYTALKGKTGRLTRAENVADGVVKAEEIVGQGKILDKVDDVGKSSTSTDFYVGQNGKALPSQYKDWIGMNMQEELLSQAENPQLQNAIKQLYRGKSFIGDGGTADVIRFEQETGIMLGKNSGSHVQKGIDMASYIENKILTQNLSDADIALATKLLEDLNYSLGR